MGTDAPAGDLDGQHPGHLVVSAVDFDRSGAWRALFEKALGLMDHLEAVTQAPMWTFGGGTVLMLRLGHRLRRF